MTLFLRRVLHDAGMHRKNRSSLAFSWNWKCALLSATARSAVYLAALTHSSPRGSFAIVGIEMLYVSLTAGIYAGLQQRALDFRPRRLGNFTIVIGVPALSQLLDWLTHRAAHAGAPARAIMAACIFTFVSALFHLHVMRRGAFITGHAGRSLVDDFRRMPRLIVEFVVRPIAALSGLASRAAQAAESKA